MESMKATGMKGSFCSVFFFCLRDYAECFLSFCFFWGIDKERRRQAWMEVETCGESRKVVKSVLIFIYIHLLSSLV